MTNRGDRLRQAREKRFKSARQAALVLKVPVATYNAHERAQQPGGRDYSPEDAQFYAHHFGVSADLLLMGRKAVAVVETKSDTPPHTVPLIGYVGPRDVVRFFPADEALEAPVIDGAASSTVAIELRNDGDFHHWLAYYNNLHRPMTPALIGQVCVVEIADGSTHFRRVERSRARGFVHLVARTQQPIMDARPVWAARVTMIRPR